MPGLGIEVERLEEAGGRGGWRRHIWRGIFPFTASAALIFSSLSRCLVPDLQLDPAEVRDEIQSADKRTESGR